MTTISSETKDSTRDGNRPAGDAPAPKTAPAADAGASSAPVAKTADSDAPASEPKPEPTLEELLQAGDVHPVVRKALEAERERAKQAEDRMLRTLAETDNQKKRLAREQEDRIRYANESLLLAMLPVLDNLELSLSHARDDVDVKQLRKGVELTASLFRQVVKDIGVHPITAERGLTFDPALHEAVAQDDHADLPERAIAAVVQSGFKYRERVLRPARVTVATGKGRQQAGAPEGAAEMGAVEMSAAASAEASDAATKTETGG